MNNKFDELASNMAQFVTRGAMKMFGSVVAGMVMALFAGQAHAADLYADGAVTINGDGTTARPYWRITDAVARARLIRQTAAIPASERIVIHVAPGAYLGSEENAVLNKNPRYEILPILLNVPNLTLGGATELTLDARSLPTGMRIGTETLLQSLDNYGIFTKSVILISRTTDGGVGNDVTVTGLHVDLPEGSFAGEGIIVDRVSNFRIQGNVFTHAGGGGIITQNASGVIEDNLAFDNPGPALGFMSGGSTALPARIVIRRNRGVESEGGVMLCSVTGRWVPHVGANDLEIVSQQATFDGNDLPNTLVATVADNDFSHNHFFGIRLVAFPYSSVHSEPNQGLHGFMAADVTDNTMNENGLYGVSVDTANSSKTSNQQDSFSFKGTFQGNQLIGNGRAAFLFDFTVIWVEQSNLPLEDNPLLKNSYGYLQSSTYDVTVLDGEGAGFDYDNPTNDPIDGTVLNNTLIVNGAVVPAGRKISPLSP